MPPLSQQGGDNVNDNTSSRRKTCIVYFDWRERFFPALEDDEIGQLFRAILDYSADGVMPDFKRGSALNAVFMAIKVTLDDDLQSYETVCERNRVNGQKGGRPRKTKETQQNPLGFSETQKTQSPLDTDTETKTKTGTKTHTETEKKKEKADAFSEFAGDDADLLSALTDFEKMRKSIKKPMTDRAKTMLVNKLSKDFPPYQWIPVLEQSISHCWSDLYPLKEREQQKQTHSAMDDLRQLHEMFGNEQ